MLQQTPEEHQGKSGLIFHIHHTHRLHDSSSAFYFQPTAQTAECVLEPLFVPQLTGKSLAFSGTKGRFCLRHWLDTLENKLDIVFIVMWIISTFVPVDGWIWPFPGDSLVWKCHLDPIAAEREKYYRKNERGFKGLNSASFIRFPRVSFFTLNSVSLPFRPKQWNSYLLALRSSTLQCSSTGKKTRDWRWWMCSCACCASRRNEQNYSCGRVTSNRLHIEFQKQEWGLSVTTSVEPQAWRTGFWVSLVPWWNVTFCNLRLLCCTSVLFIRMFFSSRTWQHKPTV